MVRRGRLTGSSGHISHPTERQTIMYQRTLRRTVAASGAAALLGALALTTGSAQAAESLDDHTPTVVVPVDDDNGYGDGGDNDYGHDYWYGGHSHDHGYGGDGHDYWYGGPHGDYWYGDHDGDHDHWYGGSDDNT
jgi:hypothetical protein